MRVTMAAWVCGWPSPPIVPYTREWLPSFEQHGGIQCVSGPFSRFEPVDMARLERKKGAPIVQQHTGSRRHDCRSKIVIDTLDERNGIADLVNHAKPDRVAF